MKLSSLNVGDKGKIISILSSAEIKNHLEELCFVKGVEVEVLLTAPLGEPTLFVTCPLLSIFPKKFPNLSLNSPTFDFF